MSKKKIRHTQKTLKMSRSEMNDLMMNPTTAVADFDRFLDLEEAMEDLMYFNMCDFEPETFDESDLMQGDEVFFDYPQMDLACEEETIPLSDEQHEDVFVTDGRGENLEEINVPIVEENSTESPTSKNELLSSGECEQSIKVRYTRQYLMERRSDPLSMTFPNCLVKFYQSGEVPLRESEKSRNYRSMDHILFYTSLPYSRMGNSFRDFPKRNPFKLCY